MNAQNVSGQRVGTSGESVTLPLPTVRRAGRAAYTPTPTPTGTALLRPLAPSRPSHLVPAMPMPMATPTPRAGVASGSVSTVRTRSREPHPAWLLFMLGLSIAMFTTSVVRLFHASANAHARDVTTVAGR